MIFPYECQGTTQHRKLGATAFLGHPSFSNLANLGACFSFRRLSSPSNLLPTRTILSSLGWPPLNPCTNLAFVPQAPQLDSGSQVPAAGLSGRAAAARPPPRGSSRSAGRAGRRRPRQATAAEARASARQGLGVPRETARVPALPPLPRSLPQVSAPEPTPHPRRGWVPAPGAARPVGPPARTARSRAGRTPRPPGQAARPPRQRPAPRGSARSSCPGPAVTAGRLKG